MLVLPETFAEQPPRPVAGDRVTDAFAGDHAQPGCGTSRQALPVGDETAQRQAFTPLPHPRKIPVLTEAGGAAQSQASGPALRERLASGVWGRVGHERAG